MYFFFFDEETGNTEQVSSDQLPEEFIQDVSEEEFQFFNQKVRYVWHKQKEEFYFSIVDVVGVLTDQPDARHSAKYWSVLKTRLNDEGNQLTTNCSQLKMKAQDGKMRMTDVANTEQLLRIIQSVPSPKAEPFKLWLARVGKERLDEMADPEQAISRAVEYYRRKGYDDKWINQRLRSIEMRKELTDEWSRSGIKSGRDFAILTNILTKEWSGKTTNEYKSYKGLRKENLRDNMTNTELALNILAEVSATELSKETNPQGFDETASVTKQGGAIAGNARKELEKALGHSVISSSNANGTKELE